MPRRRQFNGICHDILDSFTSRYNDIGGYWALGQFAALLTRHKQHELHFLLMAGMTKPEHFQFSQTATYYKGAILRLMHNNAMPHDWLADAFIRFRLTGKNARCEISITADTGRIYHRAVIH